MSASPQIGGALKVAAPESVRDSVIPPVVIDVPAARRHALARASR